MWRGPGTRAGGGCEEVKGVKVRKEGHGGAVDGGMGRMGEGSRKMNGIKELNEINEMTKERVRMEVIGEIGVVRDE